MERQRIRASAIGLARLAVADGPLERASRRDGQVEAEPSIFSPPGPGDDEGLAVEGGGRRDEHLRLFDRPPAHAQYDHPVPPDPRQAEPAIGIGPHRTDRVPLARLVHVSGIQIERGFSDLGDGLAQLLDLLVGEVGDHAHLDSNASDRPAIAAEDASLDRHVVAAESQDDGLGPLRGIDRPPVGPEPRSDGDKRRPWFEARVRGREGRARDGDLEMSVRPGHPQSSVAQVLLDEH